jgi:hypothetical protein
MWIQKRSHFRQWTGSFVGKLANDDSAHFDLVEGVVALVY